MVKTKLDLKLKYPQPHSIHLDTGNHALNSKMIEKAHAEAKYNAKWTQKQKRIKRRRDSILELTAQEKIYCNSHKRYLCVQDIHERKCYMRHGKKPICNNLLWENSKGQLVPYGK